MAHQQTVWVEWSGFSPATHSYSWVTSDLQSVRIVVLMAAQIRLGTFESPSSDSRHRLLWIRRVKCRRNCNYHKGDVGRWSQHSSKNYNLPVPNSPQEPQRYRVFTLNCCVSFHVMPFLHHHLWHLLAVPEWKLHSICPWYFGVIFIHYGII